MKIKKVLIILVCLGLCITVLAGCNRNNDDNLLNNNDGIIGNDNNKDMLDNDRDDNNILRDRTTDNINWQYKTADEIKQMLDSNEDVYYIDIRTEEEYKAGHFSNALGIFAHPIDTIELETKVRAVAETLDQNNKPIVVVGPDGSSASMRAVSILVDAGISENRLFILENGANAWPYNDVLVID